MRNENINIESMDEDFYINLIYKKLEGELNNEMSIKLDNWVKKTQQNRDTYNSIKLAWDYAEPISDPQLDLDDAFAKVERKIKNRTPKVIPLQEKKAPKANLVKYVGIAAIGVILIAVGSQFLFTNNDSWVEVVAEYDTEKVVLPDNSTVILRKNSVYKYSTNYKNSRESYLNGEAFFNVTSSPNNAFIVKTEEGTIEVLGTSFNVKTNNSSTHVAVKTGKVSVTNLNGNQVVLTPGKAVDLIRDKASIDSPHNKIKQEINWTDRYFKFQNENLSNVIAKISSAYPVKIIIDESIKNCPVTVTFDNQSLDTVLETISTILSADLVKSNSNLYQINNGRCVH